ncbi:MAG: LysR family transcriptional regulator [Bacilli bacterium]|nr:LysR family transcriptional regulator [Bacilli bacterium]
MIEYKDGINLNLYRIFYYVAKEGSISAAAKKIYVSQPAISKSLKKLEELLNVDLFYRTLTGVQLTEFGETLLFYVENSYNSLLTAERTLLESKALERGKVSIGVPSHIGSFFLFEYIEKFKKDYPNIKIKIVSRSTNEMIEQLESHEIDFMIDSSPVDTKYNNVIVEKLVTFPNSFITNKKYDENMNSLKDFEDEPFILPVNRSSRRKELESLLTTNNIELKNIIEIETTEMAISAAKKGFGICVIAEEAVKTELEQGQLYKLNVKEKLPGLEINIVYIENFLPPAPRKFIDMFLQKKDQK